MKHRVMTIYGKRCVAIHTPRALSPRLFAKASDKPLGKRDIGGVVPVIATMHSLRLFDKDGNYCRCPFHPERIRADYCHDCEHNLRKHYCLILPPASVECALYDARKMSVSGDYRSATFMPVLDVSMADVDAMAEYATRIPKHTEHRYYSSRPQKEKVNITNELIAQSNEDEE